MKQRVLRSYDDMTHVYGRIFGIIALAAMLIMPVVLCLAFKTTPDWSGFGGGTIGTLGMFWAVCIIEFFTYVPMLGSAGSYISFITGDVTTLKVPCALNAMNNAKVNANSEEGELISTIAITIASIVTIIIAAVGIIIIATTGMADILSSATLSSAFKNALPAMFGGLAVAFISKNWKLSIVPVVLALVLFISLPSSFVAKNGTMFVPVFATISILVARLMYKKGFLGPQGNVGQESEVAENKTE